MSNPTVSVILPVYNGEKYLRFAIESVLNQTYENCELIVIDDGSSDSTPAIAQAYGQRLRYVRQANTGVAGAFNHGLRLAKGQYISWLSHDDVFAARKLEKQVAALMCVGEPAVSYTDIALIDETGKIVGERLMADYQRDERLRHVLTGGEIGMASYSICYDRQCVEEVGFYSEVWPYTQDAEMLMRLVRRFPLVHVREVLMQVREHEQRGIRSHQWEREVVKFFRAHLNALPLEELFPELRAGATPRQRAEACVWLGDKLCAQPFPIYTVSMSQYRRALRECPAWAITLLRKLAWVARRYARESRSRK